MTIPRFREAVYVVDDTAGEVQSWAVNPDVSDPERFQTASDCIRLHHIHSAPLSTTAQGVRASWRLLLPLIISTFLFTSTR